MSSHETVTVITPAYNSGKWLDETIQSVRQQTHANLRYIIVDDGSTDDSLDIARRHADQDPRLQVLSVNYGSVSRTRQAGIDEADSEYIAFLDGDDRWSRHFLGRTVGRLRTLGRRTLAVYTMRNLINERGEVIEWLSGPGRGSSILEMTGSVDFDNYLLADTPARTASAVLLRATVLKEHAFRQEAEPCEDYELWLRILFHYPDCTFYGMSERLIDYRIREQQQTVDVSRVFTSLDHLYAAYVPKMRQPEARWEIYESAASGAQARGLPEFALHFRNMAILLSEDPNFRPYTLSEITDIT